MAALSDLGPVFSQPDPFAQDQPQPVVNPANPASSSKAVFQSQGNGHPAADKSVLDFNPRIATPDSQETLRPLDTHFLAAIDEIASGRPAALYVCIRSFGCDPTAQDGRSDIPFALARSLAVILIEIRRDIDLVATLPPDTLNNLLRFCHVDGKDVSPEGIRKSKAKLVEHFCPSMLEVATMDASSLRSVPVFGLWAYTAVLGGRILANVKKERLVSILQLAQQQSVMQGLAVPEITRPWRSWSCPDIDVLRQLSVTTLNAILGMTDLSAVDDECKESLVRQIIGFRGPSVDNSALPPATVEMLFSRGPLLRAFLSFFGVPFQHTVNLHCHQLLSLVPVQMSRTIPHKVV